MSKQIIILFILFSGLSYSQIFSPTKKPVKTTPYPSDSTLPDPHLLEPQLIQNTKGISKNFMEFNFGGSHIGSSNGGMMDLRFNTGTIRLSGLNYSFGAYLFPYGDEMINAAFPTTFSTEKDRYTPKTQARNEAGICGELSYPINLFSFNLTRNRITLFVSHRDQNFYFKNMVTLENKIQLSPNIGFENGFAPFSLHNRETPLIIQSETESHNIDAEDNLKLFNYYTIARLGAKLGMVQFFSSSWSKYSQIIGLRKLEIGFDYLYGFRNDFENMYRITYNNVDPDFLDNSDGYSYKEYAISAENEKNQTGFAVYAGATIHFARIKLFYEQRPSITNYLNYKIGISIYGVIGYTMKDGKKLKHTRSRKNDYSYKEKPKQRF